jgi:hypothetical protein
LPENHFVKAIRLGRQEFESGAPFDFLGAPVPLEIVVSGRGGQLNAQVVDDRDQAVAEARLVLVPNPPRRGHHQLYRVGQTNEKGEAVFSGVAPGDYKLFAWSDIEPGKYYDPDFIRSFERSAPTVSIRENGHQTAQLALMPRP